jgi:hypothetical protein
MGDGQPRETVIQETWGGAIAVRVTAVARGPVVDWP